MKNSTGSVSSQLILASASPRRVDLLANIGVKPDRIIPADIDETEKPRELPRQLALRLAVEKAMTVRDRLIKENDTRWNYVLAADTVVAAGRRILPKAESEEEARLCMQILSGRRHRIYGGIALIRDDGKAISRVVTTIVSFKRLSALEIDDYVGAGEWMGKAGGYAVQGLASAFVKFISGSHSNIVGLSCYDTMAMLQGLGFRK